jgi:hypothetical protein
VYNSSKWYYLAVTCNLKVEVRFVSYSSRMNA